MASRNIFDLSAYSSQESTNLLHQSELQTFELASRDEPQPFKTSLQFINPSRPSASSCEADLGPSTLPSRCEDYRPLLSVQPI
jgi:hypothetical protein